jgi:hypothetical protein
MPKDAPGEESRCPVLLNMMTPRVFTDRSARSICQHISAFTILRNLAAPWPHGAITCRAMKLHSLSISQMA